MVMTVVIASACPYYTRGLTSVLREWTEFVVKDVAHQCETILSAAVTYRPAVLIVDGAIDSCSPRRLMAELRAQHVAGVLLLVGRELQRDPNNLWLFQGGVSGLLPREIEPELLRQHLNAIGRGGNVIAPEFIGLAANAIRAWNHPGHGSARLTTIERRIALGVRAGDSNRAIAASLGLTEQAIKNHLRRIFRKLVVANRVELAVSTSLHEDPDAPASFEPSE